MPTKRITRDQMLERMHDDLSGTPNARSKRAANIAKANDFTQYEIKGVAGFFYDPIEVDAASEGIALPKKAA